MRSTWFTIAGAMFELVGLGLVFIEIALIRSAEFDAPTPWARLLRWWRNLLRHPQVIAVGAAAESNSAAEAYGIARPGHLQANASESERIHRLERYVEYMDSDLADLHGALKRAKQDLSAAAREVADDIRAEIAGREATQRARLRTSLVRQTAGASCVLIGITFGTIGNLL